MRLIDEEVLMKDIQKTITEQSGTIDWLNMIYRQPISYDVDKVVEQLEEFRDEMKMFGCDGLLSDLIEVVKGGGVDAESRIKAVPILWETN